MNDRVITDRIITESDTDSTQGSPTSTAMNDETLFSQQAQEEQGSKDDMGKDTSSIKFRPYQAEKWQERFEELLEFRKENMHCLVPHTYPQNPGLARWVKRQRYQYTLFHQKKKASINLDRIKILDDIGFVWDSHEATWQERLASLSEFKKEHGHCEVPSKYEPNAQLATWVKCQRRQYKLFLEGEPSNITQERITELERYGFKWEIRKSKTFEQRVKSKKISEQKAKVNIPKPKSQKFSPPKVISNVPFILPKRRLTQQGVVGIINNQKRPRSSSEGCVKTKKDEFIIGSNGHVPEQALSSSKSESKYTPEDGQYDDPPEFVVVSAGEDQEQQKQQQQQQQQQQHAAVNLLNENHLQHLPQQNGSVAVPPAGAPELQMLFERVSALENVVKMQQDLIEQLTSKDDQIMNNDRTICTQSVLKYMTREEAKPHFYNGKAKKPVPSTDMETAATLIELTTPNSVERKNGR